MDHRQDINGQHQKCLLLSTIDYLTTRVLQLQLTFSPRSRNPRRILTPFCINGLREFGVLGILWILGVLRIICRENEVNLFLCPHPVVTLRWCFGEGRVSIGYRLGIDWTTIKVRLNRTIILRYSLPLQNRLLTLSWPQSGNRILTPWVRDRLTVRSESFYSTNSFCTTSPIKPIH